MNRIAPSKVFGQQIVSSVNKNPIFSDQSAGSRLLRLKQKTSNKIHESQPKNGLIVKNDDNMSRFHALTRVRAGGYMVHRHNKIHMF